jgi:hypothetical protein
VSDRPQPEDLRRLINGFQVSQAIYVAATLGVADLLAHGPRSSDELAEKTHTDAPSLYRLLRALVLGGRERTEAEYAALFAAAGLRHTGTTRSASGFSVFEAAQD